MANYDRRFLVPYLEDVYSMELFCLRLQREINQCKTEIDRYSRLINEKITDPKEPYKFDPSGGLLAFGLFCGIACCLLGWWAIAGWADYLLFDLFGAAAILFGLVWMIASICGSREEKEKAENEYYQEMKQYRQKIAENKTLREEQKQHKHSLFQCHEKLEQLNKLLCEAQQLREKVYGVNVIARNYRNIYAAYYLYDFFESSKETDLEKVMQLFVLEEIKLRLDRIIKQNEQVILTQRIQIALQQEQNRMLSESRKEEMRRLASIEANQERQIDYQKMIVANQEVTNFILSEEFLQKY